VLSGLLVEERLHFEHVPARSPGMGGAARNEVVAEVLGCDLAVRAARSSSRAASS
jgi:hypothetical protein